MLDNQQNKPGNGNQQKAANQEEFDECMPLLVRKWLKSPPLLPSESRTDFIEIFRSYELTHAGKAGNGAEYWMVWRATVLTMEIMRYERMKVAIMRLKERPAVESMLQKAHAGAAMSGAAAALKVACQLDADKYYADPKYKEKSSKQFEMAGFGPDAVEGEAFMHSLRSLATIEKLIASKEKLLHKLSKELETRYSMRAKRRALG